MFAKFFEWHAQQHDDGTSAFLLKLSSTGFPKKVKNPSCNTSHLKNINLPLQLG